MSSKHSFNQNIRNVSGDDFQKLATWKKQMEQDVMKINQTNLAPQSNEAIDFGSVQQIAIIEGNDDVQPTVERIEEQNSCHMNQESVLAPVT